MPRKGLPRCVCGHSNWSLVQAGESSATIRCVNCEVARVTRAKKRYWPRGFDKPTPRTALLDALVKAAMDTCDPDGVELSLATPDELREAFVPILNRFNCS